MTAYFILRASNFGLQRLPSDVPAVLHAAERDPHRTLVGARDRFPVIRSAGYDCQHAAARGYELSLARRRSCVIHLDAERLGILDAPDRSTRFERIRVAARCEDDAHSHLRRNAHASLREAAARTRE